MTGKKLRFEDPRHEAWANVMRAQRRVTERVQAALAGAGLPPLEWYDVLLELKMAPGKRLRQQELANAVVFAKSNLTRLLDRMEHAAVISRMDCDEDKRSKFACLQKPGSDLLRKMWPVYRNALDAAFSSKLSVTEANTLNHILGRIRKSERAGR